MCETMKRASVIAELQARVKILTEDLDASGHDVAAALAEEIHMLLGEDGSMSPKGNIVPFPGAHNS